MTAFVRESRLVEPVDGDEPVPYLPGRDGADGQPLEVHLLEFPSDAALDDYMHDERRTALAGARDSAIARTDVVRVNLV